MTALSRWREAKLAEEGLDKKSQRRPYLASECHDLKDAERWRLQIIKEISKKVSQIQNAGLGEFRIRDLNDEINKLLREKGHWETRIIELGGRNMRRRSRMLDNEGKEVAGSRGYKYFGAARDLPGVRELFESQEPVNVKKTRAELMKDIDSIYYGFLDDDDERLIPLEVEAEKAAVRFFRMRAMWEMPYCHESYAFPGGCGGRGVEREEGARGAGRGRGRGGHLHQATGHV